MAYAKTGCRIGEIDQWRIGGIKRCSPMDEDNARSMLGIASCVQIASGRDPAASQCRSGIASKSPAPAAATRNRWRSSEHPDVRRIAAAGQGLDAGGGGGTPPPRRGPCHYATSSVTAQLWLIERSQVPARNSYAFDSRAMRTISANEVASLGVQVHGGGRHVLHQKKPRWQHFRDARIAQFMKAPTAFRRPIWCRKLGLGWWRGEVSANFRNSATEAQGEESLLALRPTSRRIRAVDGQRRCLDR